MSRFLTGNLFRSWVPLEDYLISRLICSLRTRFWLHFPNDLCSFRCARHSHCCYTAKEWCSAVSQGQDPQRSQSSAVLGKRDPPGKQLSKATGWALSEDWKNAAQTPLLLSLCSPPGLRGDHPSGVNGQGLPRGVLPLWGEPRALPARPLAGSASGGTCSASRGTLTHPMGCTHWLLHTWAGRALPHSSWRKAKGWMLPRLEVVLPVPNYFWRVFSQYINFKAGLGLLGWIFSILLDGERAKSRCQFSFSSSLGTVCRALIWGDLNLHWLCQEGVSLEGFSGGSVFYMLYEYWFFTRK